MPRPACWLAAELQGSAGGVGHQHGAGWNCCFRALCGLPFSEGQETICSHIMWRPVLQECQPVASTSDFTRVIRCRCCARAMMLCQPVLSQSYAGRHSRQTCHAKGFGSQVQESDSRPKTPDQQVSSQ